MQREEDKSNPASADHSSRSYAHGSSIRIGNHIPLAEEQRILSFLKILILCMLVLGGVLTAWAWAGWYKTHLYQLFVLGCFAPFAVFASVVSLVGITRSLSELGDRAALLSRVKGTVGEDLAQFGLYTSMCAFTGLLLLGVGCLMSDDQLDLLTSSEASDAEVWAMRHPTETLADVRRELQVYLVLAGSMCLLHCFIGLLVFWKQLTLSVDNESQHVLVQVLSFIQMCLGLMLLCSAAFTYKAKTEVGIEGVSDSFLGLVAIAGLCAIGSAFLGFRGAHHELITDIIVYIILTLIALGFTMFLTISQLTPDSTRQTDMQEGCLDSLALISQDYLRVLGCPNKYLGLPTATPDLHCLKSQTRVIWEQSDAHLFGCLNVDCCGYFISATKSVYTYATITLMACAVVETLAAVAAMFLVFKILRKGKSIFHEADAKVFFLMLLFGGIGGGLIFASVVYTPYAQSLTSAPILVSGAGQIDESLLGTELCIEAPQIHLPKSLDTCPNCDHVNFLTTVQADGGHLVQSYPGNVTVIQDSDAKLVFSSSYADLVSAEVRQTWFCPTCPDAVGLLNVTISRETVVRKQRRLRGLQEADTETM